MRVPRFGNPLLIGLLLIASLATAGVVYGTAGSGITTTMIVQGNFGDIDVKTNFDGHKVDIDTKGDSDLYLLPDWEHTAGLNWSPDDQWIVVYTQDGNWVLLDPEGGGTPIEPAWSERGVESWQRLAPPAWWEWLVGAASR